MAECIQNFKVAQRQNPGLKLNFNWYVKLLPMHEFPKIPTTTFGIAGGVLSREEKKKHNRTKFSGLYLDNIPPGCIIGETILVSLPPITLGICYSRPLFLYQCPPIYSDAFSYKCYLLSV